MKGLHIFLIIVGAFGLMAVIAGLNKPREFDWTPDFDPDSKEPFGCEAFDRLVRQSVGDDRYSVSQCSFAELAADDDTTQLSGVLVVDYSLYMGQDDVLSMLQWVRRGNKVMMATYAFEATPLCEELGLYDYFCKPAPSELQRILSLQRPDSEVEWVDRHSGYPSATYHIPNVMFVCGLTFEDPKYPIDTLLFCDPHVIAVRERVGQGEIYLVKAPLLFTNYGILRERDAELVFRLLSQFGDLPIVRLCDPGSEGVSESTPLDYILSQQPLRVAFWLAILLILLFMFTTARRRQRAVPVVRPPQNHSLEFVRLIGTLYWQEGVHADLVRKKYQYTAERLRRTLHVDIADAAADAQSASVIARESGMTADEVTQTLTILRRVLDNHDALTEEETCYLIDQLRRFETTNQQDRK